MRFGDIAVDISAGPETGSANSDSFLVPETDDSSDRFEFFIVYVDADEVDPADFDSINSAGVERMAPTSCGRLRFPV
jgi:hypothetical protein